MDDADMHVMRRDANVTTFHSQCHISSMVATAGFRSRLVQQDSSGKLLVHRHKSHLNGRNVLLDNLMRRAAQTLWPARTANKKGKSTRPGQLSDSLRSQSREAVPTLDTLRSDSDPSMGRFSVRVVKHTKLPLPTPASLS